MRSILIAIVLTQMIGAAFAAAPVLCTDRIVLKARAGTERDVLHGRLLGMGLRARAMAASAPLIHVDVEPGRRVALLNELAARSDVAMAAPVYRYSVSAIPNDPGYPNQYHHPLIGSPAAWDVTRGSGSTIVAILDTGVDPTHPDLAARLLPGYNAYAGTTDTRDAHGHGTAVAGCIAAIGNNGAGVAGMSWSNPLLPVRIIDENATAPSDTIAAGMRWAADHGAKIINCSFSPLQGDAVVSDAAAYARSRGALVFVAMGNDGHRVADSEDPNITFVTATDAKDAAATFTNTGPAAKLAAPGVNILTTNNGGGTGTWSGTSFSSPIAAGAAALVWAANPALTPAQVEQCLFSTAHDLGTAGRDETFGYGRLDVGAAVRKALAPPPARVAMQSPASGSTLPGTSATFAWDAGSGVSKVFLYVGTAANPTAYGSCDMGLARGATVSALPTDGSVVVVTLWSLIGGAWQSNVYGYRAASIAAPAAITSPAPGSALAASRVTFAWSAGSGATAYYLYVGSTAGGADLAAVSTGTARSYAAALPLDGRVLYVRLWSLIGGGWRYTDAVYRAALATAAR